MRDILLQVSGAIAIVAALIHGVLSETKVFPRDRAWDVLLARTGASGIHF